MQILIATKNTLAAKAISHILRKMGHSCTICSLGSEVELFLKAKPVELVISDVSLKTKMNSSITQMIRKHHMSSVPIILLAAIHEEDEIKTQLDQGANDYVLFPIEKDDLIQKTKLQLT